MTARVLAWVILLVSPATGPAVEAGSGEGPATETAAGNGPAASVWSAADGLGFDGPGVAAPGWFAELGAVTREAVSEEWESEAAAGLETEGRPGGGVAWRRFWNTRDGNTDTLLLFAGLRRNRVWGSAGWSRTRRGSLHASHVVLRGTYEVAPRFLAGVETRVFPAASTGAPDLRVWCVAVRGPGMAGVRLGPEPENYSLGLGVRLDAHVTWYAHISDLHPALGIAWRLGSLDLQAESVRHPFLGAVTRFRIRWRGRS